jgi:putative transcriptional regulator
MSFESKRAAGSSDRKQCEGRAMPIIVNLDVMLAKRKMRSKELAERIGITEQNLSILKTGKAKAIRFSTLEAICQHLSCQPGDLLEYCHRKHNYKY